MRPKTYTSCIDHLTDYKYRHRKSQTDALFVIFEGKGESKKGGMELTAEEVQTCREHCALELKAWLDCTQRQNIIDWAKGNTSLRTWLSGPCQQEQKDYQLCIVTEQRIPFYLSIYIATDWEIYSYKDVLL